jgi:hypothetical protein
LRGRIATRPEPPVNPRRRAFAVFPAILVVVAALSPNLDVLACGPDFEPDVFVRKNFPDNFGSFAQGQLGILQTGYDSNEYAVAYRYLNGGKLSSAELQAYVCPTEAKDWSNYTPAEIDAARQAQRAAQPPEAWLHARAGYFSQMFRKATEQFPISL